MTPEELETALRAGDVESCRRFALYAEPRARRAAASLAADWFKAAMAHQVGGSAPAGVELPGADVPFEQVSEAAALAWLGSATFSEIKAMGWRGAFLPEGAYAMLAAWKPAWLSEWADWMLEQSPRSWYRIRQMVRAGVLPTPTTDAYTSAMLGHGWPRGKLELLREDPGLLEYEIWRVFEVEGGGEDSLAARDKYSQDEHTWAYALLTLAAEGMLDRNRLLDASLDALERDFAQFRVGWFSHFHEALKPTVEERLARADRYLALLGNAIPPTVSFALKALAALDKAGKLPGEAYLRHVSPALGAREKSNLTLALRLLDRAVQQDPTRAALAARLAAEALVHESPEVQGAVLDRVERFGSREDAVLREQLSVHREGIAASQRPRLDAWLGLPAASVASDLEVPDGDLEARLAALPPLYRELAGVDAADGETLAFPPLDLRDLRIPRLDPAARLEPVGEVDELLDLFTRVLENVGPPDDLERVLDGVSHLCAARTDDWERRTAPLCKRAGKLRERTNSSVQDDLCRLALAWLGGEVADPPADAVPNLPAFLSARVLALSVRAAAGDAGPLLGAPTHAGGWIEPGVLVERVRRHATRPRSALPALSPPVRKVLKKGWAEHDRFEMAQALLRLAPEGRAAALDAAADLEGELGDALRYALGADGIQIGPTAALWAAAARARSPWADDPDVAARHPEAGPGAGRIGAAGLEAVEKVFSGSVYYQMELRVEPPLAKKPPLDMPVALHYAEGGRNPNGPRMAVDVECCLGIWPLAREAWSAAGAWALADNIDWWEAYWGNRIWLLPLLDPDTHLGPMAGLLLNLGLAAKDPSERGLATDVLIAAVADGRVTGASLGEGLREVLALGPAKGARVARTLTDAARTSPLHGETVRMALEWVLAGAPSYRPADLAALLELLQELCAQSGAGITDPAALRFLEAQGGSGKGAKLAKALRALNETAEAAAYRRKAAALAREGRVARAERWAQLGNG